METKAGRRSSKLPHAYQCQVSVDNFVIATRFYIWTKLFYTVLDYHFRVVSLSFVCVLCKPRVSIYMGNILPFKFSKFSFIECMCSFYRTQLKTCELLPPKLIKNPLHALALFIKFCLISPQCWNNFLKTVFSSRLMFF